MIDNADLKLRVDEVQNIDFLAETPNYFNVTGEHYYNGETVLTGNLDGLKITASKNGVNIKDGSLCKYYLGDNFQTMGRGEIKRAIEKLSDILHLPIEKATVTRLDIAQNFIVKHPTPVYFNHLGSSYPLKRLEQPDGLYYTNPGGLLIFYDKVKEQKDKGQTIPELYRDRNTIRYESRYKKRLTSVFNINQIIGETLYNEEFYMIMVNKWRSSYRAIKKLNDISLNFEAMKGKKDFNLMGRLSLINQTGGELAMIEQINEAFKKNELTRRQADELKEATREACQLKEGIMIQSDVITELDKKIEEACKFYR